VEPVRALVLDATSRPSLAACRTLGRSGYDVGAGGYSRAELAGYSRYTARYHMLPSSYGPEDTFAEGLEAVIRAHGYNVLIATDDGTLARLNARPPSIATVPTLGPPFALLTDKLALSELGPKCGFDYPATYPAEEPELVEQALDAVGLPAIVKAESSAVATPERVVLARGASVVRDRESAHAAAVALARSGVRPIVQERVRWTEKINAVVIRRGGESEFRYAHRALRELPPEGGLGITLDSLPVDDPAAADALEALEHACDAAGYEGIAQAEFYRGFGRTWLLDVNPRLWGSTWFIERMGLRAVERAARAALGEPPLPRPDYPSGKRFHHLPSEWVWVFRHDTVLRPLLEVIRDTRRGDFFEYADLSDNRVLVRYALAKAAGLPRLLARRARRS
jgi:predicted ATP-grasp superfamily ATP-dependent carboligase